jgi:pimeloyl-ACP methyl ester carboxylesterase
MGMRSLRSPLGSAAVVLLLGFSVVLGTTVVRVLHAMSPQRQAASAIDFESMLIQVREVEFPSADELRLSGWLFPADPGRPTVILCHDAGQSKAALINLAISLSEDGFGVLVFDFRGHGASGDGRTTLGLHEKRDVLGAVDYLARRPGGDDQRIGVFGVGMGAHAAVLAALDRPAVKVLVLDGLYPDVAYPLAREVFDDWELAARFLGFLPRSVFLALCGSSTGSQRAADHIGNLIGRDLLLLAPEDDERLVEEMRLMYETIPEQVDADGNLVVLPATQLDRLSAQHLDLYQARVRSFFVDRLDQG